MSFTRRDFLKLLAGAALAASGIGGTLLLRKILENEGWPTVNVLNDLPNELSTEQLAALVGLVQAIFIMSPPSSTDHYERMFRVRSETQEEFLVRYRLVAHELQLRAGEGFQKTYGELEIADRRLLVQREIDGLISGPADPPSSPIASIQETIIDAMKFYMYTDAYLVLGYEAWPGIPRGLITYRQAPQKS